MNDGKRVNLHYCHLHAISVDKSVQHLAVTFFSDDWKSVNFALRVGYPESKPKMRFQFVKAISSMTDSFYFGNICYIENELETGKAIRSALRISLPMRGDLPS